MPERQINTGFYYIMLHANCSCHFRASSEQACDRPTWSLDSADKDKDFSSAEEQYYPP